MESDSFISADWGTTTIIDPDGRFELTGDGGYYRGLRWQARRSATSATTAC